MRADQPNAALDSGIRYRHILSCMPLPPPIEILRSVPPTPQTVDAVMGARESIRSVLDGEDPRLIVMAGPCSIHDPDAAIEFADRLSRLSDEVADSLLLVMRVHFDKPRASAGWSGLIVDPGLDGSCRVDEGLYTSRRLMAALAAAGLPVAVGLAEPWVVSYLADLMSWAFIGATSSATSLFREFASGLPCPVGFKNSQDGNLESAVHAICAAARPQQMFGLTETGALASFATSGNRHGHLILRGGTRASSDSTVARAGQLLTAAGLPVRVIVDCGRGTAGRDPANQVEAFRGYLAQLEAGQVAIRGLMLESNLVAGCQPLAADPGELQYGVSITDPCLDWETTETLVRAAAQTNARILASR